MLQYSQNLRNPYYFFTDNILFNISSDQHNDGCGLHLVSYEQKLDKDGQPVTKTVKVKETYLDETHTPIESESEKEVPVYTDEINVEKCKMVFPYFIVRNEYKADEESEAEAYDKTYFIQNTISVGDKSEAISGEEKLVKFVRNNEHTDDSDTDYLTYFRDGILEDVKKFIKKGYTIEKIKTILPYWAFESNVDEECIMDGRKVTFKSVEGFELITEEEIFDALYAMIKKETIDFANNKLAPYGKKVKNDAINIDKDNVTDV